jgi:hypothetical protein
MQDKQSVRVRTHVIEVEPPDLLIIRVSGEITFEDIQGFSAVTAEHTASWPYLLYISDNTHMTTMGPEARKAATSMSEGGPAMRGFAIIGGGAMAIISSMLLKMISLLRRGEFPTVMRKTEAEARAWIDQRRAEIVKEA